MREREAVDEICNNYTVVGVCALNSIQNEFEFEQVSVYKSLYERARALVIIY